jgi:hypothetical protein
MNALTRKLIALTFLPVLNVEENNGFGDPVKVISGQPNRFDINNGIMVIYDHVGSPWIISLSNISHERIAEMVDIFHLRRGAYVPFSNNRHSLNVRSPALGTVS